jgi:YesN/AraC family two-component response regulator
LVVDDDPEIRTLYQRLVKEALPGIDVFTAKDGAVALKMLSEMIPSLIILDLVMPEVNGFTVLEQVRLNPKTRHVPVLVMSGKLLSYEDVQKLDYARVVFYSKLMLSPNEAIACIQKTMLGDEILPQPTSILVKQAIAYLHQNYAQSFSRQEIADAVKVSESYLTRIFKQELNMTPWDCLTRIRIQKAKELLAQTNDSVTTIAFKVGFDDSAYFSRVFRKYTNDSPQLFRTK